ncbi:MAG TPA: magnesium transporter [Thermoanaerobaculia bacterium]|nr:magnesium transporter [Thermoanaerobaculia bacterium]
MPETVQQLSAEELEEAWQILATEDRVEGFALLTREEAEEFLLNLSPYEQAELLAALPLVERRLWMRSYEPDDAADLLQEASPELRDELLSLLDEVTRREVRALLAYAEDEAGGLMSPRYSRVRPDMTVEEALRYLRRQSRDRTALIYYAYVLDAEQHLLGVVSFRSLFAATGEVLVRDLMVTDLVTIPEETDQEEVSQMFSRYDLIAIPVVDGEGRMKGIVTFDDVADVAEEEATEDIQKLGGQAALDEPYLQIGFWEMVKKRAGWLSALFLGEMLTATAMAFYEKEIDKAVVLAVFLPLIISSGGNSGSQASTLVVRAMALGEVRLRDWWRVVRRELSAGLVLGTVLAIIGFARILAWHEIFNSYGEHYLLVAATVAFSLVGVVLFGTICGSMLPLVLRRLGFDPASASAPFVATLVDVTGLVIYFTMASLLLRGTLL